MNILQVHNKYKFTGGEWVILNQEHELLKRDHQVEQLIVDNSKEIRSLWSKAKLLFQTHYNASSKRVVKNRLMDGNFDLMHVHNFFPLLTPSIFEAARSLQIPTVMSLHNFRLIHPNGLLFHNNRIDERSVEGSAYRCVMDGVYRDSKIQTAVVAHMIEYHRRKKTWHRFPSAFIALSDFAKQKFIQGGLPGDRIFVKPNFVQDPIEHSQAVEVRKEKEDYFFYAGRLSSEKGVDDLIECWNQFEIQSELHIAGDGPLNQQLRKKSEGNSKIKWLGHLERDQIYAQLSKSKGLLFPSHCYEGFPLTLIEAMAVGCPVITSDIGIQSEIIDNGMNGLHFRLGDLANLNQQIHLLRDEEEVGIKLGFNARTDYLNTYTPERNREMLMNIYREAERLEKEFTSENAGESQ